MKHLELEEAISQRTYLPQKTVALVLRALVDIVVEHTEREGQFVSLKNFGRFRRSWRVFRGVNASYLRFRTTKVLRDKLSTRIKEDKMGMDKYGVVFSDEALDKMAEDVKGKSKCPKCGADLDQVSPPHCPNCGVEPFVETEKK